MFRTTGCIGKYSSTRMCALYFNTQLDKIEKCYIPSLRLCGCPWKEETEQCNYTIPVVTLASQYDFTKRILVKPLVSIQAVCDEQKLMTPKLSMGNHIAGAPRIQGMYTLVQGPFIKKMIMAAAVVLKLKPLTCILSAVHAIHCQHLS